MKTKLRKEKRKKVNNGFIDSKGFSGVFHKIGKYLEESFLIDARNPQICH